MFKTRSIYLMMALVVFSTLASSQYWFQSGARGSSSSAYNTGAMVSIQTVFPQNATNGSMGFWLGEDLSNGGFIQVGYFIPNSTGMIKSNCTESGCTGSKYLQKGIPTWFWEYFPNGYTGGNFLGNIGGNDSIGPNGGFNSYSFLSNGNVWNFYMDNVSIGSVNMGTSTSGSYSPVAFGEYADTNNNDALMNTVRFNNFKFYQSGSFELLPKAYAYVGYGKGSQTSLPNPYGVKEIDNAVASFMVGSGVASAQNNSQLWTLGYMLNIVSPYGAINSSNQYFADSSENITAPANVSIGDGARALFLGWDGTGQGSYTGNAPSAEIDMYSNITETAVWQRQYYLNASSNYTAVSGGGWYDANATAIVATNTSNISMGRGSRMVFGGWSNGMHSGTESILMDRPLNLSADWIMQYLVNATSSYGTISGSGWHDSGSVVNLTVSPSIVYVGNRTRYVFGSWSNGNRNASMHLEASSPISIMAVYNKENLIHFAAENDYGEPINASLFGVSNLTLPENAYLPSGKNYSLTYVYFKNVTLPSHITFNASAPSTVVVKLPVYNINISVKDLLGYPLAATANITFYNGTSISAKLNSSGKLTLHNVPYGYLSGDVKYGGVSQSLAAQHGTNPVVTLVDPYSIAAIIALVVILVSFSWFVVRRTRKKSKK